HVVALRDFTWLADGYGALVLEWVAGPSVTEWLDRRHRVTPGEATTVVVSVLRAEGALRAAGWASDGGPSPSRFRLDGDGRPVLVGLGGLVRRGAGGTDDESRAVFDDDVEDGLDRGVRALLHSVALRLPPGMRDRWRGAVLHAWHPERLPGQAPPHGLLVAGPGGSDGVDAPDADDPGSTSDAGSALEALEDAVFAYAPPEPLTTQVEEPEAAQGGAAPTADSDTGTGFDLGPDTPAQPSAYGRPLAFETRGSSLIDQARNVIEPLIRGLRRRRRPLIVAGVAGAVALAAALAALPLGSAPAPSTGAPGDAAASTGRGATDRDSGAAGAAGTTSPSPSEATGVGGTAEDTATPSGRDAGAAADPASAAVALLLARERCFSSGSAACLARVDEPGSPQARADAAVLAGTAEHKPVTYAGREAALVQRNGGAALVSVDPAAGTKNAPPLSVLVMETESGWALREVFG
ncbi:MAG TPA: hypothetical protein VFQ96_05600, partial [Microbacteriaceae bacterium]|nr:hypothetical protein [Microbacteriaceae bacterium]